MPNIKISQEEIKRDASEGLTFTGFLGTVTLFFAGLLIAQFDNFDDTIRVPVAFLVICTFALLYAAILYANTSGMAARKERETAIKSLSMANALSEYFGVYLFVISIPMVIIAITDDLFLRLLVSIVAIIGLFLYSNSDFSLLNRSIRKSLKYTASVLVATSTILLVLTQLFFTKYLLPFSLVFIFVIGLVTYFHYLKE